MDSNHPTTCDFSDKLPAPTTVGSGDWLGHNNESMQMQTEYQRHIAELDKTLSMLREGWMESKPADKSKWMDRINSMLDERLRLMSLRDNALVVA